MGEFMHESVAAFMDDVFIYGIDYFFPHFLGVDDPGFREDFKVMGYGWLGKSDFLHDAALINLIVTLDDVQDCMPVAVMDGSEEHLPFFGTRAFHIEPHQYDTTVLPILRTG